jgi:hypothetical protein
MKIYVVKKDNRGKNVAFLRREDATAYNEEYGGHGVAVVESEELNWMKQAADAAVEFIRDADMGTLEVSTLSHRIRDYEGEIFDR